MSVNRRDFIRSVGVALASLLAVRCRPTPTTPTCYAPVMPTPDYPTWDALRGCWLDLDNPQLQSYEETEFSQALRQRHAAALDELVANGEVERAVADEIAVAFEQAVAHIQRQVASCYIMTPPEFAPRQNLVEQAAALEEMAAQSDIDPATVAQAQEAIERDVAWLAQFAAGETPGEPDSVEVTPEAAEAARILVQLLLDQQP